MARRDALPGLSAGTSQPPPVQEQLPHGNATPPVKPCPELTPPSLWACW